MTTTTTFPDLGLPGREAPYPHPPHCPPRRPRWAVSLACLDLLLELSLWTWQSGVRRSASGPSSQGCSALTHVQEPVTRPGDFS